MRYVIGLDGGGTKTAAVLLREDGEIVGRGQGGPANHNFSPADVVCSSIREAVTQALSGLPAGARVCACGGAVLAPPALFAPTLAELLGPDVPYERWSEGEVAGVGIVGARQPGVVLIAGTGSQATGWGPEGQRRSVGGWGTPLGDEGGAGSIGWRALNVATRAYDGRLPQTRLLAVLYAHFGISDLWQLIPVLYRGELPRHKIAALAPLVAQCAQEGDAAAQALLREAGEELALLAATAARHVGLEGQAFPVVMAGAVFRAGPLLLDPLRERLAVLAPGATLCWPRYPSEVGAALLTLEKCGISL